jgi:hypothetical protein
MLREDSHLSDQELLLAADGEISPKREGRVEAHLAGCWACRARQQEIADAMAEFVRFHQQNLDVSIPPAAEQRSLLKAQLAELAVARQNPWPRSLDASFWRRPLVRIAAVCAVAALAIFAGRRLSIREPKPLSQMVPISVPKASITPGAAILLDREGVCSATVAKNRPVPDSLQRKVFEEYGITGAEARAYEVDYLITPALGGADDIHNLWPQSYSATVWNAQVKDALEDRLRDLVCEGKLDLTTAQRDISGNWIAAYKRYFHTDTPIEMAR